MTQGLLDLVKHAIYKDEEVDPKMATKGILDVCNINRRKFTS